MPDPRLRGDDYKGAGMTKVEKKDNNSAPLRLKITKYAYGSKIRVHLRSSVVKILYGSSKKGRKPALSRSP